MVLINGECNKSSFHLNSAHQAHGYTGLNMSCDEKIRNTKISGVIGPITSRQSIMVSSLLSIYEIPTLSTMATSDELSDKSRFVI